jgi:hypothetical protein
MLLGGALAVCLLTASRLWPAASAYHAIMLAGYDVLSIKPGGSVVTFLGLVECPQLEGARQIAQGVEAKVINADGKPLAYFPSNFSFRVTASLQKPILMDPTDVFNIADKPEDLLLKLKFRLRVYHGLQVRQIMPVSVQMIGVPADVPYNERVYRVNFSVNSLPVADRCMLEVLSPEGKRLTKFYFLLL